MDFTKLFALPKFGSLRGSTSASLKIGENFGNPPKNCEFLKLGVALILRYLVTDLLLMQTKLAKIRSSATLPLVQKVEIECKNLKLR